MAAGDPIAIVNTQITALNAIQVLTMTAADQTTDATAQKFVYTPTGKDNKIALFFYTSDTGNATATATIAAGVGVFGAAAKALTIPSDAGTYVVQIETGKYMLANGTIEISILPPASKDLVNDYALTVGALELQ